VDNWLNLWIIRGGADDRVATRVDSVSPVGVGSVDNFGDGWGMDVDRARAIPNPCGACWG